TLSGNPVAMAAGLATLRELDGDVYAELGAKTKRLTDAFREAAAAKGIGLQTACFGGMFGFFFADAPVRDYDDALASRGDLYPRFFRGMLEKGVYLAPSPYEAAFVSTAHSDADLERTIEAFRYAVGLL
ncbi:MAG TPA: aspartate aminotransferase family protein, partial [bacterium]